MSAGTETEQPQSAEETDPRFQRAKAAGAGDPGREMLEHVVQGATLDDQEEGMALDYLLGSPEAARYDVEVQVDTPRGRGPVTFDVQAQDGKVIERLENMHRQANGMLDTIPSSCAIVAQATVKIVAGTREIDPRGTQWLTMKVPDTAGGAPVEHTYADAGLALARRFSGQQGLIVFVANEIRRVSGYDAERVGQAKRKLVHASLD